MELYQRIEHLIGKKLPLYKTEEDEVMALQERVAEAQRNSKMELKDLNEKHGKKGGRKRGPQDDTEQSVGLRKRLKGKTKSHRSKKKFSKKKH